MPEITKTIKLHLNVTEEQDLAFQELTNAYKDACNFISGYVFTHDFELNSFKLQNWYTQTALFYFFQDMVRGVVVY